ncbi:AraC family transcriptional regulator (plasmid) [Pararhizobium polonicum]|uniref:AraC family transcriptional regulator n=1 Tax=Pararhizobium polonicum TaxID=1612624 RepID=A0A1C7P8M5_9HYPH|nr:helix-turn-helix domain-containing protein [Pararhizobium polonicum]OBZ97551.1 AraC family transcriptional regulator [Pararhizobium polonicum]
MREVDHNSNSLEAWKEQLWLTYVRLESKSDAPNFYGDVLEYFRGADSLSLVNSTSQLTERTCHHIRADGQEVLLIAFQIEGRGAVYQDERVAETEPGKLVFYDSTKPYRLVFDGPFRQMVLRVSHATLRSRSHGLRGLNARTFQALEGSAGVALDFLKSIAHRANEIGSRDLQAMVAVAGDLVINGILSQSNDLAPRLRLFEKLRNGVSGEVRNPEFGTSEFAVHAGMSKRSLRRLCAENGTSPGQMIRDARLQGAKRELAMGATVRKSITDIALGWGFNDISHFNRSFKSAFVCTPSQWRRAST